jgi:hypothetical protein
MSAGNFSPDATSSTVWLPSIECTLREEGKEGGREDGRKDK